MKRRSTPALAPRALRFALRTMGALVTVAVPAVAGPLQGTPGAPEDQYEKFDRNDLVVTDKKTRLVWARIVSRNVGYADTGNACQQRSELLSVDRRLPTVKELLTLVDEFPHDQYDQGQEVKRAIDLSAFDGGNFLTPTDRPYWTSTDAGSGKKWVVDFTTGEVTALPLTGQAHVRCVRK